MSWNRQVAVTLDWQDVTSATVESVEIIFGARSWWEPAQPAECRLTLYGPGVTPEIGQRLTVTLEDSSATPVTIWTGTVDTIGRREDRAGVFTQILSTGPLTRIARRALQTPRYVEPDGDRIAALVRQGLSTRWNEVEPALRWDQVNGAITWADYGPDLTLIDQPGLYDIADINQGDDIFNAIGLTAFSADGHVYETKDGQLGYLDAAGRENLLLAGPARFPGSLALLQSIRTSTSRNDIVNQAVVDYDGGEVTQFDQTSAGRYGVADRTYLTNLALQVDAERFAGRIIDFNATPRPNFESGVILDLSIASDLDYDALIAVNLNDPILLEDIQPPLANQPSGYLGFVEGYRLVVSHLRGNIELFLSDYRLSLLPPRWTDVDPYATWLDIDPTLTWDQARVEVRYAS